MSFSVQNMIQKPTLEALLALLPAGEWPVLRDGVPHGIATVSAECVATYQSHDWHIFCRSSGKYMHTASRRADYAAKVWVVEFGKPEFDYVLTNYTTRILCTRSKSKGWVFVRD